jgi:hypothetical protein
MCHFISCYYLNSFINSNFLFVHVYVVCKVFSVRNWIEIILLFLFQCFTSFLASLLRLTCHFTFKKHFLIVHYMQDTIPDASRKRKVNSMYSFSSSKFIFGNSVGWKFHGIRGLICFLNCYSCCIK